MFNSKEPLVTLINAILVSISGQLTEETVVSGNLTSIRAALGNVSHIELVALPNGHSMYLDEEGKLNGQQVNHVATDISGLAPHDIIMGPAIILGAPNNEGYDLSINPDYAKKLLARYSS
jgi:hypothetical protein